MRTGATSSVTLQALAWSEFKKFLREPPGNIFALVIPLTAMIVSGIAYGNVPDGTAGVYGPTDLTMPGQLAATIAAAGFMVVPAPFVLYRQRATRRASGEPDRPPLGVFFRAQILVALAVILAGAFAVLVVGSLAFGVRPPQSLIALLFAFALCCASIVVLGIVVGAIVQTVMMARAVGLALFLLNLFASGSAIPPGQLPAALKAVGTFMPLTYVRNLLAALWFGTDWDWTAVMVLVAVLLACAAASFRLYQREQAGPNPERAASVVAAGRAGRRGSRRR